MKVNWLEKRINLGKTRCFVLIIRGVHLETSELYLDVVSQLEKRADSGLASMESYYHKTLGHKTYGISTSEIIELIRTFRTSFKELNLEERLKLARMFFESGFSEQAAFGNSILELSVVEILPGHFDIVDEIAGFLNNWGSTDWSCIATLQPMLRKYPKETLNLLRKWNSSESVWKKRASIVAFTRKIGEGDEFTDKALELCNNLIWDEEDMVRKGVFWALKDNMRGNKKKILDYVKSLRQKEYHR